MLTEEEQKEIEEGAPAYPNRQALAIDALKIVQRHRGWISDVSLREIAEFLNISTTELDSIATFYNLIFRRPVGRHVILMCDSVSCWIMGCTGLREQLNKHLGIGLGQTTQDNRFTLLPIVCLGCCDRAPAMMIDDDLHGNVDPQKIDAVLEKYQ
jgi:NADH-quinone oxidoreductase subunit E